MPSKFHNLATDTTLGGNNASDEYAPSQAAVKTYVDSHGGDTGYSFSSLSDNASTITFGASKGYFRVNVTGSTQTFNLAISNTCVNYLLVINTGSSDCTVALGMQSGGTWTSFVLPTDAITVPTGKAIELSFISINSHKQLVITKSAEMEVTTLS